MIYIVSQKYLEKHIQKLVAPRDYLIIDGENSGSNASSGYSEPISQKYNKCMIRGGFCPERETINILRAKKKGKEYSKKKLKRQIKEFFKDIDFLEAAFFSMKAQSVYGVDKDINVFVCLPTIIFKEIGQEMASSIQELSGVDFQFVFTEKTIKESGKKVLEESLKKKQLKEINKVVRKAEKKYEFRCRDDDFDDDD